MITGRSKEPDKYDQVLDRKCVEALARMKRAFDSGKPFRLLLLDLSDAGSGRI